MVSYQTWIVIVLSGCAFGIALVLDPASGVMLTPVVAVFLKVLAFTIPLAANQLKTVGQQAPNTVVETRTTTVTPPETKVP